MTDEMHRHLTALGTAPVPDPDPVFVTDLELRLRALRAAEPVPGSLRPRRWPATVAAVTFSLAVVAFGLATLDTGSPAVRVAAASGVSVRMPDGAVVIAEPGLDLPEGARVEVGPTGSARIGDIDLGPGQVADVTPEGIVVAFDRAGEPSDEVAVVSSVVSVEGADEIVVAAGAGAASSASATPGTPAAATDGGTAAQHAASTAPAQPTEPAPATVEPEPVADPSDTDQVTSSVAPGSTDATGSADPSDPSTPSPTSAPVATSDRGPATTVVVAGSTTTAAPSATTEPTDGLDPSTSTTAPTEPAPTSTSSSSSSSSSTTSGGDVTTTTLVGEVSSTSIVRNPKAEAQDVLRQLRAGLHECQYTLELLRDLTQAVVAGELTVEDASALLRCGA